MKQIRTNAAPAVHSNIQNWRAEYVYRALRTASEREVKIIYQFVKALMR